MTVVVDGTSGITFPNSTTQAVAALPLTGGTLTGTTTFTGGVANAYGFGVGTAVPSSGAGISFPATQSASSDANTLDDYEEGTWTPVITAGSGSLTSYTSSGQYTKIGNTVFLAWQFVVTSLGTASGSFNTTNLPFTSANYNANIQYFGSSRENQVTGTFSNMYLPANSVTCTNISVTWGASYGWGLSLTYRV